MPPLLKLQGLHREERIFTRIFTEGFHRLGETETEWRQREVPLLLFPSSPRKKHLIYVVAGGKEQVGGSIKACCFSPTSRKKQSKIDMKWTDI